MTADAEAVCAFANDRLDALVLVRLAELGVRLVALRSAGFNNVGLAAARDLGLAVARVPTYPLHSVAEHTAGMILELNRQLHRAIARVREGNFALEDLLRPARAERGDRRDGQEDRQRRGGHYGWLRKYPGSPSMRCR